MLRVKGLLIYVTVKHGRIFSCPDRYTAFENIFGSRLLKQVSVNGYLAITSS